ncbi:MAG: hypothetical protein ACKVVP_08635 [Chloroflexota bacterium]
MAKSEPETFESVRDELTDIPGVVAGKMFGMPVLKINGKAFAGANGAAMVFKLDAVALARALAIPEVGHFDPMGGRPMREWVEVPAAQAEHWLALSRAALDYVRQLSK